MACSEWCTSIPAVLAGLNRDLARHPFHRSIVIHIREYLSMGFILGFCGWNRNLTNLYAVYLYVRALCSSLILQSRPLTSTDRFAPGRSWWRGIDLNYRHDLPRPALPDALFRRHAIRATELPLHNCGLFISLHLLLLLYRPSTVGGI